MTTLHYHWTDDLGWRASAAEKGTQRLPEEIPHLFYCRNCSDGREGGILILRWFPLFNRIPGRRPIIYCADCGRGKTGWDELHIIHRKEAARKYSRAEIKRMEERPPISGPCVIFSESETEDWM